MQETIIININGHTCLTDVTCENNNIKAERWGYIAAEYLYTIETKLVLFTLDCYKFKMSIVITKVTTKKIINIQKRKVGHQNDTLQKIHIQKAVMEELNMKHVRHTENK